MRKILNSELGRASQSQYEAMDKLPVVIVLDNVRSGNNIGSFFRTADAFGLQEIILCGICACPPSRDIHKTALGAESTVKWSYCESTVDAIERLKGEGYTTLSIEQVEGATMLNKLELDTQKRYAIVFGNEVEGVSQQAVDACHGAIEIPQVGTKHSINVSVCGGVVLWEFFKQLSK